MKKPATSETPCQPHVERQLPLPLLSCLKAVREGFFELCIHVGEQALHALMEQDRTALCGARWSRDPSRRAVRGGSTASEITLGGRRIRVRRRRAAQVDGPELALPSFGWAADRDPLDEHTWRSIVAGVSTRSYGASLAPVPNEFQQRSTSRSAVSRRFVALSLYVVRPSWTLRRRCVETHPSEWPRDAARVSSRVSVAAASAV